MFGRKLLLFVGDLERFDVLYAAGESVCECVVRCREAVFKRFLCSDTGLVRIGQCLFGFAAVFREQVCRGVLRDLPEGQQSCLCRCARMLYVKFRVFRDAEMFREQVRRGVLRHL